MPTYQYACTDCQEQLEVVQSFSDASLTECPSCGGRLRKKYGAVGVVFKGSGFYKTDSRSEGGSKTADAGKGDGAKTADAPKADAPAAKKDSAPASTSSSTSSATSGGSSTSAA